MIKLDSITTIIGTATEKLEELYDTFDNKVVFLGDTIKYKGIPVICDIAELDKDTILILDEPERHRSPSEQAFYMAQIVLLGLKVIISTNSLYILNALDVFAFNIQGIRFYLHYSDKFIDVTNDLERAYSIFAKPLQTFENFTWADTSLEVFIKERPNAFQDNISL